MQGARGSRTRLLLLLLPLVAGCSKKKAQEAPGYKVEDLWVETDRVTFKDHVRYDEGQLEVVDSSENKVDPEATLAKSCQGRAIARENVDDPDGSDEFISVTYSCLDDKGVGHYAMVIPEQRSTETYEIKYELVEPVRLGRAWSSEHTVANNKETRSCQVRKSRYCDEGVSTVCVTEKSGGSTTWMRQHYCKGQGWRGYEVVSLRAGKVAMQGWSSDVVADGVALDNAGETSDLPTMEQVLADAKAIAEAARKEQ